MNTAKSESTFGCVGSTIRLSDGNYFDLLHPDLDLISIEVIGSSLSKLCRFGGHCPKFYSVAEHSILCAQWCELVFGPHHALAALLHDASEAFCGDVVKPLKQLLPGYVRIENRILECVYRKFGLVPDMRIIQHCDRMMLKTEKHHFWPDDDTKWNGFDEVGFANVDIQCYSPIQANNQFLFLFERLSNVN